MSGLSTAQVAQHGGILGAAVCCSEDGGRASDDWTTCEADRTLLLDRMFTLAKERGLLLDFHADENGNEVAKGLRCAPAWHILLSRMQS